MTNDDLPPGWEVTHSPLPKGEQLERILSLETETNSSHVYSWDEIRHNETGTRVLLRMAPPEVVDNRIVNDGALVTGVIVMPAMDGKRVTAADMRFPLGSIESAANLRREDFFPALNSMIQSGHYRPPEPVGRPDGTDEFYARVAALWRYFIEDDNPTERLREINDIPLSTAQRWVTEARKRKLLPPGRRGRAK